MKCGQTVDTYCHTKAGAGDDTLAHQEMKSDACHNGMFMPNLPRQASKLVRAAQVPNHLTGKRDR
jgi:hypothetical protein